MSTRCLIAILVEDQRFQSIYCHHDGYDYNDGVGPMLRQHFNTQESADSLIALGDVSYIQTDKIYAYHR